MQRKGTRQRIKEQRERMWAEQRALCFWCSRRTQLPAEFTGNKRRPLLMATIDHLDDRFDPKRGQSRGERRHVMACWGCNQKRSQERLEQHIDIQRQRSQRYAVKGFSEAIIAPTDARTNMDTV